MAGFTSTVRAALDMDTAPFQRAAKGAELSATEMGRVISKSARDSAEAFKEAWAEEQRINDARIAQAEATNRSITASQGLATKSARESAAVFMASFEQQDRKARGFFQRLGDGFKSLKKGFGDVGLSGQVGGLLGLGAVVTGFKSATERAKELRESSRKIGEALDPAVARTAELADNLERAKEAASDVGVKTIGIVQGAVDYAVSGVGMQLGYGTGAENLAAITIGRAKEEIEKREEADKKKAAKFAEERDREREKRRRSELNEFDLLFQLEKDRDDLQAKSVNKSLSLAKRTEAQAELEKKLTEIAELRAKMEKRSADERAEVDREAAQHAKEIKNAEREANKLEEEARMESMDLVDQLNDLEEKRLTIIEHLRDAEKGSLLYQKTRVDLAQVDAQIREKSLKLAEQSRKIEEATNKALKARQSLADANRDRAAFGVDDAAEGRRGTGEERRRARRIRELEQRARRAYDRGSEVQERRDQRGNVIRETGEQESARLLGEADSMRRGFGNRLASSERDPLAAQKTSLLEALNEAQTLLDIRNSLQPATAPGAKK